MVQTIIVFSPKGGVGKTLVTANLAVSLAKSHWNKLLLIDMDLQSKGDMARMLGVVPQKAMVDFLYAVRREPEICNKEDFVTKIPGFGLDFLPGVLMPQQSPHIEPAMVKEAFDCLGSGYDFIIIDAGGNFSEIFVNTLNQANLILLVITPDVLSIYQAKWALDILQLLNFPLNLVKVVLNRSDSTSSISWQEIKTGLPCDIIAHIPSEGKAVGLSINQGIPVIIDAPKTKFALGIKKLSSLIDGSPELFIERRDIKLIELQGLTLNIPEGEIWNKEDLTEPLEDKGEVRDRALVLKRSIHNRLIEELNLKKLDLRLFSDIKRARELRHKAERLVTNILAETANSFITSRDVRKKFVKEILDEALGLGALEDLLADPSITDIMVNNKDEVFVEREGKIESTDKRFISNEQVKTIIERIIAPIGRHIDESMPMVDARLLDGSRVNAIIPPLSLTGPALTIRKFRKEMFKLEDLINLNSVSYNIGEFLKASIVARKNIIVSGGTGSGKTTVLNVLSGFVPESERIITIEDAAELRLHQRHWIRLESRAPNIEGKGAITIREIFRNTLRMRPDRIIIGECRGIETLDMLQAMNTGHDGSITTIHANSTQDVLSRLDSMILMSGVELPIRAIREMISSAIDLIVHTARLPDGSRKITQVTELSGLKDDLHIGCKDLFLFKQTGTDKHGRVIGDFQATGQLPSFLNELKVKGIEISESIFSAPA